MQKFRARLEPVPHGGQYVVVPGSVADAAGLKHGARVQGEVNGVAYRSALMKYSGVFHLGLHKAALEKARVKPGAQVAVTIARDEQPLPGDVLPEELAAALKKDRRAAAAWASLAPSHKREHVKAILDAKKPETRARRLENTLAMLGEER